MAGYTCHAGNRAHLQTNWGVIHLKGVHWFPRAVEPNDHHLAGFAQQEVILSQLWTLEVRSEGVAVACFL